MKQWQSKALYHYWQKQARHRSAPKRSEINPTEIKPLLKQVFILEVGGTEQYKFRLAGTGLCEQYGIELKNVKFLDLWKHNHQILVRNALHQVVQNAKPVMVHFKAVAGRDRVVDYEMLLLPLAQGSGEELTRVLGIATPVQNPFWLGSSRFLRQNIESITPLGEKMDVFEQTAESPPMAPPAPAPARPYLRLVTDNRASTDHCSGGAHRGGGTHHG